MCQFRGTWYRECQHCTFELYLFCRELLAQLNRINDPKEEELLPFDADMPGRNPCAMVMDETPDVAVAVSGVPGTNVVMWVTKLSGVCPECRMRLE